jgi:hypothetical protein
MKPWEKLAFSPGKMMKVMWILKKFIKVSRKMKL